eukprot:2782654-Pleurochrysis_carterae.AAC.1
MASPEVALSEVASPDVASPAMTSPVGAVASVLASGTLAPVRDTEGEKPKRAVATGVVSFFCAF